MKIVGTMLGIFGSIKLGDTKRGLLKTPILYGFSNIFLITYFSLNLDWLLVLLQLVHFTCAMRAIINVIKERKEKTVKIRYPQKEIIKVNI